MTVAVLILEQIADDFYWHEKRGGLPFQEWLRYMRRLGPDKEPTWVKRVTRKGRTPVHGFRDYTHANHTGSRGIHEHYIMSPGIYEVHERTGWNKTRRYWCKSEDGCITEISRDEAERCLNDCSE